MELGRIGAWLGPLSLRAAAETREFAPELEELGYSAIWFGEGVGTKECFTQAATLARLDGARRRRHRDRQHLRARPDGDGNGGPDARRRVPGPLPARDRGQPCAERRARAATSTRSRSGR